jgi:tetratricopeptide (TPR) repeat protein
MKLKKHFALLLLAGAGFFAAAPVLTAPAYAQEDDEEPVKGAPQLDPTVAKALQDAYTALQEERFSDALNALNSLISSRGDRMKPYDKATTYEIRASVYLQQENTQAALRDLQTALSSGGFDYDPKRNNQLRYYIAQIYMQLENYPAAIQNLNEWIQASERLGTTVDANAWYLLAAAYASSTPENYRAAMRPIEQAIAGRAEPKKSDFDLANLIYSELGENTKRSALLERIINIWPGERTYWTQLAGLYSTTGKDKEAFSVLEVAYRAGLLEKEAELLTLVNFYSFFENPYRGAKMLSREMDAGRIKKTQQNLVLLSQLWSQSREHKRAIPVLQEAAGNSSNGELSYRLGQVLLADEQYAASERALQTAINKGGMDARKTGDSYMLLGTARFSQAGPNDCNQRLRALTAFQNASRYPASAGQARSWVSYINAINDTAYAQDILEQRQNIEATEAQVERLQTQAQVCRLQADGNCERFATQIEEQRASLTELRKPITKCGATPAVEPEETEEPEIVTEEPAEEAPAGE